MTGDTRILSAEVQRKVDEATHIVNGEWAVPNVGCCPRWAEAVLALRAALTAAERELGQWDERHRAWQAALAAAEERTEQAEHDHGNLNADRIRAEAERDQAIRERDAALGYVGHLLGYVAQVRTLREALTELVDAVVDESDSHGISGRVFARVYDARAALGEKNDA